MTMASRTACALLSRAFNLPGADRSDEQDCGASGGKAVTLTARKSTEAAIPSGDLRQPTKTVELYCLALRATLGVDDQGKLRRLPNRQDPRVKPPSKFDQRNTRTFSSNCDKSAPKYISPPVSTNSGVSKIANMLCRCSPFAIHTRFRIVNGIADNKESAGVLLGSHC